MRIEQRACTTRGPPIDLEAPLWPPIDAIARVRCADQDVHPAHRRRRIVNTDVNR